MERDAKDYAIEFGEYLANAAEHHLKGGFVNEDAETDSYRALRSAIYEFRKRAARAAG